MEPVVTTGLLDKVAEQGALAAFMLLVIIALVMTVKMLYERNVQQGADNMKVLIDNNTALNNNTAALNMLGKQMDRLESKNV